MIMVREHMVLDHNFRSESHRSFWKYGLENLFQKLKAESLLFAGLIYGFNPRPPKGWGGGVATWVWRVVKDYGRGGW